MSGPARSARWGSLGATASYTADRAAGYRPFGMFRSALAATVMLHHFGILLAGPQVSYLFRQLDLGRVAVMVFFVLSGFVIAEAVTVFYSRRPLAFVANRLLRILPPFAGAIVLTWGVQAQLFALHCLHPLEGKMVDEADLDPSALLANLLAILPGAHLFNELPVYLLIRYVWAIRVELLFYLLVAACIAAGATTKRRCITTVAWFAVVGCSACVFALLSQGLGRSIGAFDFAPYFVLGAALFFLVQTLPEGAKLPGAIAAVAGLGVLVNASMVDDGTWVSAQAVCLGFCLAVTAWLAAAVPSRQFARLDRRIGALSYPLYLNHFLAGTVVASLLPEPGVTRLLAAVALALVLAAAMDRAVEPLVSRMRDRIRRAKLG